MKGLLLKDFYNMWKLCRIFLALVVIFLAVSVKGGDSSFLLFYPMLLCSMLSTSLLSYDEKFRWDRYCDTMPLSRRMVVSEKYILNLILTGTVFIATALLRLIPLSLGRISAAEYSSMLIVLIPVAFLAPSLMLPVVFKLGMEKGRLAYYIVFGLMFLAFMTLPERLTAYSSTLSIGAVALPVLLAVCLLIYAVSWLLSVRFYEKRDL